MDKYIFSALFTTEEVGGYSISFPDLPGCFTESETIEEGVKMAKEALELWLWNMEDDKEEIPAATAPESIEVEKGSFVVPIIVNMLPVREEMNNKAVKKTLTIPYWLNKIGEENKINFSQLLQQSIIEKFNIKREKR